MNIEQTLRRVGVALGVGYLAADYRRKNPTIFGKPGGLVMAAIGLGATEFGTGLVREAGKATIAGTAMFSVPEARQILKF